MLGSIGSIGSIVGIGNIVGSIVGIGSGNRDKMKLDEMKTLVKQLVERNQLDFLDISLWDVFKSPEEKELQDKALLEHFTEIDFGTVKLTVAGNINSSEAVQRVLDAGIDFVSIGKSGILHHDFPEQVSPDW